LNVPLPDRVLPLVRRPGGLWFDTSGQPGDHFVSCEPALWLVGMGDRLEVLPGPVGDRGWLARFGRADPGVGSSWDRLATAARRLRIPATSRGSGFRGGFAGSLSYDMGRRFERVPSRLSGGTPWDFLLGLYDEVLQLRADGDVHHHRLPGAAGRLACAVGPTGPLPERGATGEPVPEMTREQHRRRVEQIRDLIRAGSLYQANLTLRFGAPAPDPAAPLSTFVRLRRRNPAPYGMFAALPGTTIVSSSPESFLDLDAAGRVRSRPIKGTAPRAASPDDDARARRALLASEKDRSELSMIVDLVRNDVGRVCRPGTVSRDPTLVAEAHPTVWHLVGDVTGELDAGRDAFDLLRASFPPGSCIGAPKIRTMAALEELELSRRGPYTGALGWIGLDGTMGTSVAIRTLVFADGQVRYGVGGGIVWDSDADAEWREALLKGRALAASLQVPDRATRTPAHEARPTA
jgi:para-aminobenzoate synthetase component I